MNISHFRLVMAAAIAAGLCFAAPAETLAIGRAISVSAVSCDESGGLKSVDLALEPGVPGMSDELYFAYGTADGGPSLDGWEHTVKVATFDEATNSSYRATNLPVGYGTAYLPFRFILVAKTLSAGYYCQRDKLVAHFDAIENKAFGAHDDGFDSWTDLSGHRTVTRNGYPVIGEKGISFTWNTSQYYAMNDAWQMCSEMGNAWTVEAVVTPAEGWKNNYSGICGYHDGAGRGVTMGQCSRDASTGKYNAGFFVSGSNAGKLPTQAAVAKIEVDSAYIGSMWTFSLLDSPTNFSFYTNGASHSGGEHTDPTDSTLATSQFCLGRGMGGNGRNFSGQIHSVRVYRGNLTPEEIAANRKLDEARFGDGDVTIISATAEEGSVWREVRIEDIPAQALPAEGACEPPIVVRGTRGSAVDVEIPATDYEVAYANNDEVGLATVTVTLCDSEPMVKSFVIGMADIPAEESYPKRTLADYYGESLFANFDAIENAGIGRHDATTTTWVNLQDSRVKATYQMAATPAWTENGVKLEWKTTQFFSIPAPFMSMFGTRWTVEALVTPGADYGNKYSGIFGNHGNSNKMGFGGWQTDGSESVGFGTYCPNPAGGADVGGSLSMAELKDGNPHLLSATMSVNDRRAYLDGVEKARNSNAAAERDLAVDHDPFFIGRGGANNQLERNFSGTIHAIRVYTNLLSAAAVARNWAVDRERFFGAPAKRLTIVDAKKSGSMLQLTLRRPEAVGTVSVECLWGAVYHGTDHACWQADCGVTTAGDVFADGNEDVVIAVPIQGNARYVRFESGSVWSPTLDLTKVREEEIKVTPPELGELTVENRAVLSATLRFSVLSAGTGASSCDVFMSVRRGTRPAETNLIFAAAAAGEKAYDLPLPNPGVDYEVAVFAVNDVTNAVASAGPVVIAAAAESVGSGIALLCPTNGLFAYYDAALPYGVNGVEEKRTFVNLAGGGYDFYYSVGGTFPSSIWTENGVEIRRSWSAIFQYDTSEFIKTIGSHGVWTIQTSFTPSARCYAGSGEYPGIFGGHSGSTGIVFGQFDSGSDSLYFGVSSYGQTVPRSDLPSDVRAVVTLTGSPTQYVFYKDGQQYGEAITPSETASTIPNPQKCAIGAAMANGGRAWDGYIDYVRIYTNALSAAEQTNLYQLDLIRQGKKDALDFKRLVNTGHGVRGKVALAFDTDRPLDLWVAYGSEYAGRDAAQWSYRRRLATFDPTASGKRVSFAVDGFTKDMGIRYVRFVLLPAGTAEERLTDLGAWCRSCYVPDMRYQPDGTLVFVR